MASSGPEARFAVCSASELLFGDTAVNVVGLMSGTSADGVDAVVVEIAGAPPAQRRRLRAHVHTPYEPALRREVLAAMVPEQGTVDRLCRLNVELGLAFAWAAQRAIAAAGLRAEEVELIGSHGQTFWHAPAGRATRCSSAGCGRSLLPCP
jgi:anhydro-N-acetylmuramic acid kinase